MARIPSDPNVINALNPGYVLIGNPLPSISWEKRNFNEFKEMAVTQQNYQTNF